MSSELRSGRHFFRAPRYFSPVKTQKAGISLREMPADMHIKRIITLSRYLFAAADKGSFPICLIFPVTLICTNICPPPFTNNGFSIAHNFSTVKRIRKVISKKDKINLTFKCIYDIIITPNKTCVYNLA